MNIKTQAHSGEHLFVYCLNKQTKIIVDKINITDSIGSLFVTGDLTINHLIKAQELIIDLIKQDLPVKISYKKKDEVTKARIKKERIQGDSVRIVNIGDLDYSACSGEHVKSTKEIDFFLVTGYKSLGNNHHKIDFIVGEEAKKEAASNSTKFVELVHKLNTPKDKLVNSILKGLSERDNLKNINRKLSKKLLDNIDFIAKDGLIKMEFNDLNQEELIKKASELSEENNVVFINDNLIICAGKDAEELFKKYNGKGGGKPNLKIGKIN